MGGGEEGALEVMRVYKIFFKGGRERTISADGYTKPDGRYYYGYSFYIYEPTRSIDENTKVEVAFYPEVEAIEIVGSGPSVPVVRKDSSIEESEPS